MSFDAKDVMKLRGETGAGMMDCKRALVETNGIFEEAIVVLKKKGLAAADKKSGRTTAEGLISIYVDSNTGVILELNSETDFVAKNDKFQSLATNLAKEFLLFSGSFEEFKETRSGLISEHVAVIGENITLRRAQKMTVKKGVVGHYIHNGIAPGLGKIGVLISIECEVENDKLQEVSKQIAMHIAASKPEALTIAQLDKDTVAKEREILTAQVKASGKPENIIDKMVEGRIVKFYEQVVLLEQPFIIDGKTKITQVLENLSKEINSKVTISSFVRYALGEGIEKQQTDFAKEVADTAKV